MRNLILFIFLLNCFIHYSTAQEQKIQAKVFGQNKKAILRWAPVNAEVWKEGNISGYRIKKIRWENALPPDTSAFRNAPYLTKSEIKPYAEKDTIWKRLMMKNENAILVNKAI